MYETNLMNKEQNWVYFHFALLHKSSGKKQDTVDIVATVAFNYEFNQKIQTLSTLLF